MSTDFWAVAHARRRQRTRARLEVVVAAGLALGLVALHLVGLRVMTVLTGSMHPAVPRGALVVTVPASPERLVPGALLAFRPPAPYRTVGERPVLHRITAVRRDGQALLATTRGDANPAPDPWSLDLRAELRDPGGAALARPVAVVPRLGWVLTGGRRSLLLVLAGGVLVTAGVRALRRRDPVGR